MWKSSSRSVIISAIIQNANQIIGKMAANWIVGKTNKKKVIVMEPRFSDEFESAIRHFYEVSTSS